MRYRFGHCELIPSRQELFRDGRLHAIEPQVFDLLLFLVKEHERMVSRDELIEVIWHNRIVSDSAISARISAARAAIGDDGVSQDWIRTLPRRGFRFVGQVEILDEGGPASPLTRQHVSYCRSADGTRIALGRSGTGYPMLKAGHWLTHLEHDWHSPIWRPFLKALSEHFELVRYDQRGNGLSQWDATDFTMVRFVEDMEAVVEAAALERFALYASSQGVPVALEYAARHPGRISHLVLQGGFATGRLLRSDEGERAQAEAILTLIRHGWGRDAGPFIKAFSTMFMPGGTTEQLETSPSSRGEVPLRQMQHCFVLLSINSMSLTCSDRFRVPHLSSTPRATPSSHLSKASSSLPEFPTPSFRCWIRTTTYLFRQILHLT